MTISFFRSEQKNRDDRIGVIIRMDFGKTDLSAKKAAKAIGQMANTLRNIFGIELEAIKS